MSKQQVFRIILVLAFLGAGLWSPDGRVAAAVLTVGPAGSDCDFTLDEADPIGKALLSDDSPLATEIRVVTPPPLTSAYKEDISVGRSVTIRGGFDSCEAARNGDLSLTRTRTDISTKDGHLLTVQVAEIEVVFSGFSVFNCDRKAAELNWQGGAFFVGAGASLTLENVAASGCAAAEGGVVYLNGGDLVVTGSAVVAGESALENNVAGDGGAIYCEGGGSVYLGDEVLLASNQATGGNGRSGHGGAIYSDDCTLEILSRGTRQEPVIEAAFLGNTAQDSGGAVYAVNSRVYVEGGALCARADVRNESCTTDRPVRFEANEAVQGHGGAIYAEGLATLIAAEGAVFTGNSTTAIDGSGGAIALTNDARLQLGLVSQGYSPKRCGLTPCLEFSDNQAGGQGGAIWTLGAASQAWYYAEFLRNSAKSGSALSLNFQNGNNTVLLANSVLAYNGASEPGPKGREQGLIEFSNSFENELAQHFFWGLTFVGNQNLDDSFDLLHNETPSERIPLDIRDSLFLDNRVLWSDSAWVGGSEFWLVEEASTCNLIDNSEQANRTESFSYEKFGQLEDPLDRDYRPRLTAEGTIEGGIVDACSAAAAQFPALYKTTDFLQQPRGVLLGDDAAMSNDAGAVERQAEPVEPGPDDVFQDRFEELPPPT